MTARMRKVAGVLSDIEIWLVGSAIVLGSLEVRLAILASCAAGFYWLVRWAACGRLTTRTRADVAIAVMVLLIPVTLWVTPILDVTLSGALGLLLGVLLYYSIVNWAQRADRLGVLLVGAALMGAFLALGSPFYVAWNKSKAGFVPDSLYAHLNPITSDTVHPNVLAGALVLLAGIAFGPALFSWRSLSLARRVVFAGSGLVITPVLLLSLSRGALIGLGAALALMVVLRWRFGWACVLGVGVVVLILAWQRGPTRVLEMVMADARFSGIDSRFDVWSRVVYAIRDFPFTGIGMGTFGEVIPTLYPLFISPWDRVPHAHNLLLQIAVDLGIPGLVAWLAILLSVVASAWEVYREGRVRQDPWIAGLGAGLLGSQVALFSHGLLDAPVWGTRPAIVVWAIWGLAMASWNVYVRLPRLGSRRV